jgi:hypothetical protein
MVSIVKRKSNPYVSPAFYWGGGFTALRFLGLLDVLSSTPAGPSVARRVFVPVCAASRHNLAGKAG